MDAFEDFKKQMKVKGFSERAIEEMWKWYDHSEKKGVASF
jgi:hypothetical protein